MDKKMQKREVQKRNEKKRNKSTLRNVKSLLHYIIAAEADNINIIL